MVSFFSPEELVSPLGAPAIELEARRQRRFADAKHAEKPGYDFKRYRQAPLKLAA